MLDDDGSEGEDEDGRMGGGHPDRPETRQGS